VSAPSLIGWCTKNAQEKNETLLFYIVELYLEQSRSSPLALRVATRGLTYNAPLLSLCSFRSTLVLRRR